MIFVTGATGNIGREVVKELVKKEQPVRAAAIDEKDALSVPQGVDVAIFDFAETGSYQRALDGVKKVFLMRPPQITDMESTLNRFVDHFKSTGIKHIVFVSLLGVENNPRVPHYAAEEHIKTCGIPYTFLRPSFFMQNLSTTHRDEIRNRDEIYLPVGKARTSFIDTRDIGSVAARVLTENRHEKQAFALTGGEALDYDEVAQIFSQVLGRKITYRNPSLPAFAWYSLRRGMPLKFVLVMAMLYTNTRKGMADMITDDVERLLGRPPITFRQFVEDNFEVWQK